MISVMYLNLLSESSQFSLHWTFTTRVSLQEGGGGGGRGEGGGGGGEGRGEGRAISTFVHHRFHTCVLESVLCMYYVHVCVYNLVYKHMHIKFSKRAC